jgi:diacylglycerol kinase family enzyme
VVVAGSLEVIKEILRLSMKYHFSIGSIPTVKQKDLIKFYDLPKKPSAAIELALRQGGQAMDLILCNGKMMLFRTTVGQIPLLDTPAKASWIRILVAALKKFAGFQLYTFEFNTAGKQKINTAASGCMILQNFRGSFASRLISHDHSLTDGNVSLVISAPISVIAYVKLLFQALKTSTGFKKLPGSIGYIKSPQIDIEPATRLDVFIDDEKATHTPLHCETIAKARRVNVGTSLTEQSRGVAPASERIDIDNLP